MKPEELQYNGEYLTPESAIKWMLAGNECLSFNSTYTVKFTGTCFVAINKYGETSNIGNMTSLTPILPDPHTEIKAEYEQAIADGKIVKVFYKDPYLFNEWVKDSAMKWIKDTEYKLSYYHIDLSKLLSWSYSFGEGKEKFVYFDHSDYLSSYDGNKYYFGVNRLGSSNPVIHITNMQLTIFNNETKQEELVNIPDFCLVEIKKDTNDS